MAATAVAQRCSEAQVDMAIYAFNKKETKWAIDLLQLAIKKNNPRAFYYLGKHYLASDKKDERKKGLILLEFSAKNYSCPARAGI